MEVTASSRYEVRTRRFQAAGNGAPETRRKKHKELLKLVDNIISRSRYKRLGCVLQRQKIPCHVVNIWQVGIFRCVAPIVQHRYRPQTNSWGERGTRKLNQRHRADKTNNSPTPDQLKDPPVTCTVQVTLGTSWQPRLNSKPEETPLKLKNPENPGSFNRTFNADSPVFISLNALTKLYLHYSISCHFLLYICLTLVLVTLQRKILITDVVMMSVKDLPQINVLRYNIYIFILQERAEKWRRHKGSKTLRCLYRDDYEVRSRWLQNYGRSEKLLHNGA